HVASVAPAEFPERFEEHRDAILTFPIGLRVGSDQHADAPHPLALLRLHRERPGRRAAEQRDELATFHLRGHSMTSSAMASRISWIVSTHLPPIENSKEVNPVMFPPGRAKLGTKPCPTGSATFTKTIGIDGVSCAMAASAGVAAATITSGFKSTNSAASELMLPAFPEGQR